MGRPPIRTPLAFGSELHLRRASESAVERDHRFLGTENGLVRCPGRSSIGVIVSSGDIGPPPGDGRMVSRSLGAATRQEILGRLGKFLSLICANAETPRASFCGSCSCLTFSGSVRSLVLHVNPCCLGVTRPFPAWRLDWERGRRGAGAVLGLSAPWAASSSAGMVLEPASGKLSAAEESHAAG